MARRSIALALLLLCACALVDARVISRSLLQSFPTVAGYSAPLVGQDTPGNDISFNYVSSVQQCADICNSNTNCAGFDYIASGPSAPSQPLCIPKSLIRSTLQPFGSGNVGALYVKQAGQTAVTCEGSTMTISCPSGKTINSIISAFYGRSDTTTCPLAGNPGASLYTGCSANSNTVMSIVSGACLNKASCSVAATNSNMGGDPCGGTYKYLKVVYTCDYPPVDPATQFPAVSGYTTLVNQDTPGYDLSFNNVVSPQACADICNTNAACVGFDYIASGPSAPSMPLCIPKSLIRSTLQPFGSGNVGALYKKNVVAASPVPSPVSAPITVVTCEGSTMTISCPSGKTITPISTAFYGRSDTTTCPLAGNPGASLYTGCSANSNTVMSIVSGACLNKASCSVAVTNSNMGGDPCGGTYKYLTVVYQCN